MPAALTPWWKALQLRDEVVDGKGSINDVQMSLHNAVYGSDGCQPPYAKPCYYGEITHPSINLVQLLARIAVRLGSPSRSSGAHALYHLDQAMGGGKSHGLIGLWHLAAQPEPFRVTDIGRAAFKEAETIAGSPLEPHLGNPQVVVLPCDSMTPGVGVEEQDGPARTLHERFLWRLFERDYALYERYRPRPDKDGLGGALRAVGRPVLILVDEILDYVRQLSATEHADLAIKDMAFLRALLDVVNDVPHVAMLVVMIKSEDDLMDLDPAAQARRAEIEQLLIRNGTPATVTSPSDFRDILRRRLFDRLAPAEVIEATTARFARTMDGAWAKGVFSHLPRRGLLEFSEAAARCYPFHPSLIDIAELEWANVAGFQKVRSTIRIFAAAAYALTERGRHGHWAPLLIGPGDLPLSVAVVREALIGSGVIMDERTQANYRQVAANDIVGDDDASGIARQLDLARGPGCLFNEANPRAVERAATALFLYSIGGSRGQGRQGATEAEVKAATFVPDASYAVADADLILADLLDAERGLSSLERQDGHGGQPARLYLSTRQTLSMFYRAQLAAVSERDRDIELAAAAERLISAGPFERTIFVRDPDPEASELPLRDILAGTEQIDAARATRLVVLDPRRFSLFNGVDAECRAAVDAAVGIGSDRLPVSWGASAVFAIVNTQQRKTARVNAREYLAWKRVCEIETVRAAPDDLATATASCKKAKEDLEKKVKQAFRHVAYLAPGEGQQRREVRYARFERENQTALNGLLVWKELVERERAFQVGEFDAAALVHNLTDEDYGRPLNELCDLFWTAPRFPLLPGGEADLKRAIYQAVAAGRLRLVNKEGAELSVTGPSGIAVGSSALRLARPCAPAASHSTHQEEGDSTRVTDLPDQNGAQSHTHSQHATVEQTATGSEQPEAVDLQIGFTLRYSLTDPERKADVFDLFNELATCLDEEASYIEATVKVVLPSAKATSLKDCARRAKASVTESEV